MVKVEKVLMVESKVKHTDDGYEIPDPTPVEVPLRYRRAPSLDERIKRLLLGELSRRAEARGDETFEQANDFDVDEPERDGFLSPYQVATLAREEGYGEADDDGRSEAGSSAGAPGGGGTAAAVPASGGAGSVADGQRAGGSVPGGSGASPQRGQEGAGGAKPVA